MSSIVVKKRNLRNVLKNENKNLVKKPKLCVGETGNIITSYESILENLKVLYPSFSMSELKTELEKNKNDVSSIMDALQQKKNLRNNERNFQNLSLKKQKEIPKLQDENIKETDFLNNEALLEETVNYLPNCQDLKEVKIVVNQFKKRIEENIEITNKDEKKKFKAENFILRRAVACQKRILDKTNNEKNNLEKDLKNARYWNVYLNNRLKEYENNRINLENPNNIF